MLSPVQPENAMSGMWPGLAAAELGELEGRRPANGAAVPFLKDDRAGIEGVGLRLQPQGQFGCLAGPLSDLAPRAHDIEFRQGLSRVLPSPDGRHMGMVEQCQI